MKQAELKIGQKYMAQTWSEERGQQIEPVELLSMNRNGRWNGLRGGHKTSYTVRILATGEEQILPTVHRFKHPV